MGGSPTSQLRLEANRTVKRTKKAQKRTTKQLTAQRDDFLGKNAPQNYAQVAREIGRASGRTFPEYVSTAENRFFNTTANLIEQGRRDLENFQPNLITSRSTDLTSKYLAALGQKFANEIERVATRAGSRLDRLPGEAQRAFSASAQNPAFENLANAQYMNFSKNPPTVQTDIATTMRPFITYNV